MKSQLKTIVALLLVGVVLSACTDIPSDSEGLKKFLEQPLFLLGVMYVGGFVSALKSVNTAQRDGSNITYVGYFTQWETLVAAILAVPIAWGSLLLADQLNFAAAAAYGAIANTGMDILPGKRSQTLMNKDTP